MIPWAQTFGEGVRAPWTPRRETAPTRRPAAVRAARVGRHEPGDAALRAGGRLARHASDRAEPRVRADLAADRAAHRHGRARGGSGAGGAPGGTSPGGRALDGRADLDRAAGTPPGVAGPDRPAGLDRVSRRRRRAGAHPRPVRPLDRPRPARRPPLPGRRGGQRRPDTLDRRRPARVARRNDLARLGAATERALRPGASVESRRAAPSPVGLPADAVVLRAGQPGRDRSCRHRRVYPTCRVSARPSHRCFGWRASR